MSWTWWRYVKKPLKMKKETIEKLNQLNLNFYSKIGDEFDSTRNYFWQGWEQALNFVKPPKNTLKVLDIGAGNGRFGEFLAKNFKGNFEYLGVDSSKTLLKKAKERLDNIINSEISSKVNSSNLKDFRLNEVDITEKLLNNQSIIVSKEKFDLIVLFGVMHHIPDNQTRINLLKNLKELLSDKGVLIFTTWLFLDTERLQKRIVWSKNNLTENKIDLKTLGLDNFEMEEGDYILDWQKGEESFRYCHYYTFEEIDNILKKAGYSLDDAYLADGKENRINRYFVCSNQL